MPRKARSALLAALDALDDRLADGGFLVGHGITEADIQLWVTLAGTTPRASDRR